VDAAQRSEALRRPHYVRGNDHPASAAWHARVGAKRDLVFVEWLDSRRGEGWVRLAEMESSVTRCKSVGWIVARDSDSVTLASHMGENPDQCCGDITIPKKAILTLIQLPMPKSPKRLVA
jgi:hypothetical protein